MITAESLDQGLDQVSPTAKLADDLGADSLDMAELQMQLEYEFDIEVSDEDARRFVTVEDVVKFVQQEKGQTE